MRKIRNGRSGDGLWLDEIGNILVGKAFMPSAQTERINAFPTKVNPHIHTETGLTRDSPFFILCSYTLSAISAATVATNASRGITVVSLESRRRTATVPSACSLSPSTSIYGIFRLCASRTL